MEQPKGWSWQDRAEGSIRRGTALDPSVEPVDGVRAFPTAYLQERLLITQDQENGQEEYDQEIHELREAAGSFGWNLEICLLYTSPSPRDVEESRMPSSA